MYRKELYNEGRNHRLGISSNQRHSIYQLTAHGRFLFEIGSIGLECFLQVVIASIWRLTAKNISVANTTIIFFYERHLIVNSLAHSQKSKGYTVSYINPIWCGFPITVEIVLLAQTNERIYELLIDKFNT